MIRCELSNFRSVNRLNFFRPATFASTVTGPSWTSDGVQRLPALWMGGTPRIKRRHQESSFDYENRGRRLPLRNTDAPGDSHCSDALRPNVAPLFAGSSDE